MSDKSSDARIAEIERLIDEFITKFRAGTSDADHFITMNEIEKLWTELRNGTNNVYSDMIQELMRTVDEPDLLHKKESANVKNSSVNGLLE
ncbi:MAG: hypothetical protein LBK56_00930 [Gracilibacteraceae bacterium]|jgi:oligoendopeptidase F|nr:hypothetical protein [Gracilibacteraceae bacterium]